MGLWPSLRPTAATEATEATVVATEATVVATEATVVAMEDTAERGPLMPSPRLLPMPPLMLMPTTDTADMLPMPTPDTVPTDTDIPGMVDTYTSARGPLMPSPRLMPLPPEADAGAYYGYGGYAPYAYSGYRAYGYGYPRYGGYRHFGKRSADAEADAYGYGGYGYRYGGYGHRYGGYRSGYFYG